MARSFNGSTQFLNSASNVDLSSFNKLTISFWLNQPSAANNDDLALELSTNSNNTAGAFFVDPNSTALAANKFSYSFSAGSGNATQALFLRQGTGWHHYALLIDGTQTGNSCFPAAYADGSSLSLTFSPTGTGAAANNLANAVLYFMSRAGASLFLAASLADVALFGGVLLNASEALALARGARPNTIRSGPTYWWPIDGLVSPEEDLGGRAVNATLGATPPLVPGPPVAPFTRRYTQFPAPIFLGTGTSGARSFDGTSSGLVNSAHVPLSAPPMTMAGWVNPSGGGTNAAWVLALGEAATRYYLIAWVSLSGAAQGKARANAQGVTTNVNAESTTADTTTGTWKHIAGIFTGTTAALTGIAYLNGGGKNSVGPTNVGAITPINTGIGEIPFTTPNFGGTAASFADVGVWNVALTDAEILALAKGARPYTIRPTALIGYWPLDGLQSPEPDLHGATAINLSLVGAPGTVAGPPIMPFTPRWPQGLDAVAAAFNPYWATGSNVIYEGGNVS